MPLKNTKPVKSECRAGIWAELGLLGQGICIRTGKRFHMSVQTKHKIQLPYQSSSFVFQSNGILRSCLTKGILLEAL